MGVVRDASAVGEKVIGLAGGTIGIRTRGCCLIIATCGASDACWREGSQVVGGDVISARAMGLAAACRAFDSFFRVGLSGRQEMPVVAVQEAGMVAAYLFYRLQSCWVKRS
jgi:hypothetical protein